MRRSWTIAGLFLFASWACAGDGSETRDPLPDGDGDADSDGDSDGDGDGDTDGDFSTPPTPVEGVCVDGLDQAEQGLNDCDDLACLQSPGCCRELPRVWIQGSFSQCEAFDHCEWSTFPEATSTQVLEEGWLVLHPAAHGETGIYSQPVVDLLGEPMLTFVAALDQQGCSLEDGCRQVVGAAFTDQSRPTSGMGVSPLAGLIVDGEQGAIHLLVNGRIEASLEARSIDQLTTPRGYALGLLADGTVAFWEDLPVDSSGDDPVVQVEGDPRYVSVQPVAAQGERMRVTLFGRFSGEGSGRVGGVELSRSVCDVPDLFEQANVTAVVEPSSTSSRVGRPAVVRRPLGDGGLLMVYEHDDGLVAATSTDGITWTGQRAVVTTNGPDEYGWVARRSPTLLYLGEGSVSPGYHLWFERESEYTGVGAEAPERQVIAHAVSSDGLEWAYADEPIALVGEEQVPWRQQVGQPSVLALDDGSLLMFFIGVHPDSGSTHIGRARSTDGKIWHVSADPLELIGDGSSRDGVGYPTAVRRGRTIHLWYTGYDGSRATIAYAIGEEHSALEWTWESFGTVHSASLPWESRRVLAPAVVVLPSTTTPAGELGELHLWYTAGPPGLERIGLVTREIPARLATIDGTE